MMNSLMFCISIILLIAFKPKETTGVSIVNHPLDTTICTGGTAYMSCGFIGGNTRNIFPSWIIRQYDSRGTVIFEQDLIGQRIAERMYDQYRWEPNHEKPEKSRIKIEPVSEVNNRTTFSCYIPLNTGSTVRINSTVGTLFVIGIPDVTVRAHDRCSTLLVTWDRISGYCENCTYEVNLHPDNDPLSINSEETGSMTNMITFDNLRTNHLNVTIQAVNRGQRGRKTHPDVIKTSPEGSPYILELITVDNVCVTSFTLRWAANNTECANRSITYNVHIHPAPTNRKSGGDSYFFNTFERSYLFTHLKHNTRYTVVLSATNRIGHGPTRSIQVTTPISRGAPRVETYFPIEVEELTKLPLRISWQRPSISEVQACLILPISGYIVVANGIHSRIVHDNSNRVERIYDDIFSNKARIGRMYDISVIALNNETASLENPTMSTANQNNGCHHSGWMLMTLAAVLSCHLIVA